MMQELQPKTLGSRAALLLRLALGIVFLYSGSMKIILPHAFLDNIYAFEIVGPRFAVAVAMILPWLELILGIALLAGFFPAGASLGTVLLGLLFIGVQLSAVWRGLSISCGCFGGDEAHLIGKATLIRTGLILLAALIVLVYTLVRKNSSRAAET